MNYALARPPPDAQIAQGVIPPRDAVGVEALPPEPAGPPPAARDAETIAQKVRAFGFNVNLSVDEHDFWLPYAVNVGHIRRCEPVQVNPHALSAASRRDAEMTVLLDAAGDEMELSVLDLFGCRRVASLFGRYGVRYTSADYGVRYFRDEDKGVRVSMAELNGEFDVSLLEDVYHITPGMLDDCLARSRRGVVYLIARAFRGSMGADLWPKTKTEMTWYRDDDGNIVAYPDLVNPAYPPHPDVNALIDNQVDGLESVLVRQCGPYSVCKIRRSDRLVPTIPEPRAAFTKALVPQGSLTTFGQWLRDWKLWDLPKTSRVVHAPTVSSHSRSWQALHGTNVTSLVRKVEDAIRTDRAGHHLLTNPHTTPLVETVITDTFLAVVDQMQVTYGLPVAMRERGAAQEQRYVAARGHKAPPLKEPTFLKAMAKIVASIVGTWLVGRSSLRVVLLSLQSATAWFRDLCTLVRAAGPKTMRVLMQLWTGATRALWELLAVDYALTPACLVKAWPIFSYVMEEVLIWVCGPMAAGVIALAEFVRDRRVTSATFFNMTRCVVGLSVKSTIQRQVLLAMIHAAYNAVSLARPGPQPPSVSADVEAVAYAAEEGEPPSDGETVVRSIPLADAVAPYLRVDCPEVDFDRYVDPVTVECKTDGRVVRIVDKASLARAWRLAETPPNELAAVGTYHLISFAPATRVAAVPRTAQALISAVVTRIAMRPNVQRNDKHELELKDYPLWIPHTQELIRNGLYCNDDFELDVPSFLESTTKLVRNRVIEGFEREQVFSDLPKHVKVFAKSDETLYAAKVGVKPRAISSVDPVHQAHLCGAQAALKKMFMGHFNPRIYVVQTSDGRRHTISIYYSSGRTAEEIAFFFYQAQDRQYALFVSGDDTIFKTPSGWYANDMSQFDTCRSASLFDSRALVWQALGVPWDVIAYERRMSNFSYCGERGTTKVRGDASELFPTGIVLTTVNNNDDNMRANLYAFHRMVEGIPDAEAFARVKTDLGFTVKVNPRSIHAVDFLKCLFLQDQMGHYVMLNLPSQIVKAAKSTVDPLHVFRKVTKDPETAWKLWAGVVSMTWANIPRSYPVFGAFLSVCDSFGSALPNPGAYANVVVEGLEYKTLGFCPGDSLDMEYTIVALCDRYSITPDELLGCDAMIRGIKALPVYLAHPVLERMMRVDYA